MLISGFLQKTLLYPDTKYSMSIKTLQLLLQFKKKNIRDEHLNDTIYNLSKESAKIISVLCNFPFVTCYKSTDVRVTVSQK